MDRHGQCDTGSSTLNALTHPSHNDATASDPTFKELGLQLSSELLSIWDDMIILAIATAEKSTSGTQNNIGRAQDLERMIELCCDLWDMSSSKEQALLLHNQCCISSVLVHVLRGVLSLSEYGGQVHLSILSLSLSKSVDDSHSDALDGGDEMGSSERVGEEEEKTACSVMSSQELKLRLNRLTEAIIGTLANLVGADKSIAQQYAQQNSDCNVSECLFAHFVHCLDAGQQQHEQGGGNENGDEDDDNTETKSANPGSVEVLCEIIRFLSAALSYSHRADTSDTNDGGIGSSNQENSLESNWLHLLKQLQLTSSVHFYSALMFIMDNTLNERLLSNCCLLVLNIFFFDTESMMRILSEEDGVHVLVRCLMQGMDNSDDSVMDCILRSFECVISFMSEDPSQFDQLCTWLTEPVQVDCTDEDHAIQSLSLLDTCQLIIGQSVYGEISEDIVDSVLVLLNSMNQVGGTNRIQQLLQSTIRNYLEKSCALIQYIIRRILAEITNPQSEDLMDTLLSLLNCVMDLFISQTLLPSNPNRAIIMQKMPILERSLSSYLARHAEHSPDVLIKLKRVCSSSSIESE